MRALGLLVAVSLVAVRADDRAVVPDALSAAKNDLASLKTVAPEPASASPQPQGMENPGPASAGGAKRAAEAWKEPAKNPNWLVDAMLKPSERTAGFLDGTDALRREIDLLRSAASEAPGKADLAAPSASQAEPSRRAVVNPLEAFMDGWISPHDRDLLRPPKSTRPFLEGLEAESGDLAFRLESPAAREPVNPYLALPEAAPAPAIPESPDFNPLLAPDLPRPSPDPGPNFIPFEPKTDLPDFSKPDVDDKYFRQMKRF